MGIKITRIESARNGTVTEEMRDIAKKENVSPEFIRDGISNGSIVILRSNIHNIDDYCAVGKGLRTKVNANIGTSPDNPDLDYDLKKLEVVVEAGTDTVMDLSIGGDIDKIRREIISRINIPIGTVPIYQVHVEAIKGNKEFVEVGIDHILEVIEKHAKDGVDYVTLHCGVTREGIEKARARKMPFVSRGGSLLAGWMLHNNKENPLYDNYDRVLELAKKYDLTISLGDGLRPGCLADATDAAQLCELETIGELARKAYEVGVQVMIEGPGHIPINQIQSNIELKRKYCGDAPFYVLGPLVTDIAPGYDHITSAIGGALAAYLGVEYLCYVTRSEHLGLPAIEDAREGVIVARIAAHAADVAKGIPGARELDDLMSEARQARDWKQQKKIAIDPTQFDRYKLEEGKPCTMCGDLCALIITDNYLKSKK